ncbi:hypothetical protein DENIS_0652 [Desulfonema ishimotonii]|uniref:Uncharacterized protein n=1 Tax=Desulfonema ishimotonii TaxID=45657 RepID=A0A401FRW8_9BACT|nr:hypothetical protein DENIS_0652 [Desulfonema ishimotonii]
MGNTGIRGGSPGLLQKRQRAGSEPVCGEALHPASPKPAGQESVCGASRTIAQIVCKVSGTSNWEFVPPVLSSEV